LGVLAASLEALCPRLGGVLELSGGLRRLLQLGLEPRHPFLQLLILGHQRVDPVDQRKDQRILRGAIERLQVGRLDHPPLESDSLLPENPLQPA
jgi:hypothetical protein